MYILTMLLNFMVLENPFRSGCGSSSIIEDVFSGAHPWFLRVVVSWPQHHGDLGPEIWKSCHAHIRVISSRADLSKENLNLSGDRVLAGEVVSYGGDHSGAVRAGVGRGDGKKGGESNNEFHDDFLTSLNKSPC